MESHDGSVYLSEFSADDTFGAHERPIRVYDGTTTTVLHDPPDMAWFWFVSLDDELWMSGFRDEDFSQVVLEAGVYRWVDGVGRVSTTSGTALDGVLVEELLIRGTE